MRTRDFTRGIDPYLADRIDPDPENIHIVDPSDIDEVTYGGRQPRTDGRRFLRDPDGPWRD